jgi:hypothetical protein
MLLSRLNYDYEHVMSCWTMAVLDVAWIIKKQGMQSIGANVAQMTNKDVINYSGHQHILWSEARQNSWSSTTTLIMTKSR